MPSRLGTLVSQSRKGRELSLRKFAKLIGKSPAFVSMLENGDEAPTMKEQTLADIANELSLEVDDLLGLMRKMPEDALPNSGLEVALYRKVKQLSEAGKKELLEDLERRE